MTLPLSSAQTQQIIDETQSRIQLASKALNKPLGPIEVRFDVRGHTWGYYRRQGSSRSIRYNPEMFAQHFDEGINDTIPHEVAHYVVDAVYLRRRKPHGAEWKNVMAIFGIANPRATHKTDVSNIPSRRQRTHPYRCGCREHGLSTTRHNKIQRKKMNYFCRACGEKLSYSQTESR